ncbi:unnamed protein product [Symbiodinium microadriaticum]|nr:unnamed protein product [Symbiodinium microadriaticum]
MHSFPMSLYDISARVPSAANAWSRAYQSKEAWAVADGPDQCSPFVQGSRLGYGHQLKALVLQTAFTWSTLWTRKPRCGTRWDVQTDACALGWSEAYREHREDSEILQCHRRHRYVFTKLRAFQAEGVPYRKLIFFDLDIIAGPPSHASEDHRTPAQVTAPAGMYHGHWHGNRDQAAHGKEIPAEAFYNNDHGIYGCINAGLMRLAPAGKLSHIKICLLVPSAYACCSIAEQFTDEMLKEVAFQTLQPGPPKPKMTRDGWQLCLRLPCNDPVLQSTGNILDEEDAQALMEILAPIWPDGSWKGRGELLFNHVDGEVVIRRGTPANGRTANSSWPRGSRSTPRAANSALLSVDWVSTTPSKWQPEELQLLLTRCRTRYDSLQSLVDRVWHAPEVSPGLPFDMCDDELRYLQARMFAAPTDIGTTPRHLSRALDGMKRLHHQSHQHLRTHCTFHSGPPLGSDCVDVAKTCNEQLRQQGA